MTMKPLDTKTVKEVNGIRFEIDGQNFTIQGVMPKLEDANLSASGKSRVLASTQGNVEIGGIKWGLNVYKRVPQI